MVDKGFNILDFVIWRKVILNIFFFVRGKKCLIMIDKLYVYEDLLLFYVFFRFK